MAVTGWCNCSSGKLTAWELLLSHFPRNDGVPLNVFFPHQIPEGLFILTF